MVRERTHVFARVDGGRGVRVLKPVSPNRWSGETNCIVGPFSCRALAYGFANVTTDFGQYDDVRFQVFAKRDSWYVEVWPRP